MIFVAFHKIWLQHEKGAAASRTVIKTLPAGRGGFRHVQHVWPRTGAPQKGAPTRGHVPKITMLLRNVQ